MHLFIDILRNSILITGLVVVMMMMIESLNIESKGLVFKGLRRTKFGQVVMAALLGSVPGCMGGFATVSLYTHRMFSFGALVAMMIASSGDEAFVMLAMIPDQALVLFTVLFVLAIIVGVATDKIYDRYHARRCDKDEHHECGVHADCEGYEVHEHEGIAAGEALAMTYESCHGHECGHHGEMPGQAEHDATCHCEKRSDVAIRRKKRHFGWKRMTMFVGLAIFIAVLGTGQLGHDHGRHGHEGIVAGEALAMTSEGCHGHECGHHHHGEMPGQARHDGGVAGHDATCHCEKRSDAAIHSETENPATHSESHKHGFTIDLLSEDWMNVLFAGLGVIMLIVLIFGSDHFVEEHLWHHIVRKHLPVIFAWTFGVLLVLGIALQHVDIDRWISDNTVLMILLATAIGIIPESGPHMIFVTLFAAGVVPFPVLLASSISQDGHSSIPLLAESKKSFAWAKLINCIVALAAGFLALLIMG